MKIRILMLTAFCMSTVCGYKILCIFPVPSRSHLHLAKGVVEALLDADHQVTLVTAIPLKSSNTNLRQILTKETRSVDELMNVMSKPQVSLSMVRDFAANVSQSVITTVAVKEALIKEQYDAVITEWFFSDMDAGFAAVQKVPWIVLSTVVMHPYLEYMMDTVRSLPVMPFMVNEFSVPMNLWQRLQNTFAFSVVMFGSWRYLSTSASTYEEWFSPIANAKGVALPPFLEARYNISVMFVNSHPSFAPAYSLPPNVIEIAGYHIDEQPPPLPKDLQEILDSSPNGVVYFSMGSIVKSTAIPEHTKKALAKIFGELPYTVLWKFEEKMEGIPKNVHIRPWMPQASILAHPNVKVFITHGGLLSTLESLCYGVPMVAVPVFGDQPSNAFRSVEAGHALRVKYSPDMADELKAAVKEMMTDDRYYKKAKAISKLFNNRPTKPKKLISYYVELAIESKGAYHLRPKSLLYTWYELWMLDQAIVVAVALVTLCAILKKIIGMFTKKMSKDSKARKEKKME